VWCVEGRVCCALGGRLEAVGFSGRRQAACPANIHTLAPSVSCAAKVQCRVQTFQGLRVWKLGWRCKYSMCRVQRV